MTIVAGIDEAGLGPVLGPLVVACAAYEVPNGRSGDNLWRTLSGTVTRRASSKRRSVVINDSKEVFKGRRGFARLETAVLANCTAAGAATGDFAELLGGVAPAVGETMIRYPWYVDRGPRLPRDADSEDLGFLAGALERRMTRAGVDLRLLIAEPLLAGELNALFDEGQNKSEASFSRVAALIERVRGIPSEEPLRLYIDRQGGRMYYYDALREIFGDAWIWILEETPSASRYRIDDGGRDVEVHIVVKGDAEHLPIALASMLAKYLRELFMQMLNAYWLERVPDLLPTAGYQLDGKRFLADIDKHLNGLDPDLLRRRR